MSSLVVLSGPLPSSFPPLESRLLLDSALGHPTPRIPVWLHRQAGRYLPEFQSVRSQSDFFTVCRTPELACEVTLQPIRRFKLDAAIIFSDILVVLQAMGLEVQMNKGTGPHLPKPIVEPSEIEGLSQGGRLPDKIDVQVELGYVMDAIRLTSICSMEVVSVMLGHSLKGVVPLIGFVGAPFTLMAYAIEGGSSKSYAKVKRWLNNYPESSLKLLQKITDVCVDFGIAQINAGAQMFEVFDSWANELSPDDFEKFAKPFLEQIATRIRAVVGPDIPLSLFARGYCALHSVQSLSYNVLSIDWTIDPVYARKYTDSCNITLQGNLEPCALFSSESHLREQVRTMINKFGTQKYICNLGHGMLPEHDPNSVVVLLDEVSKYSLELNSAK